MNKSSISFRNILTSIRSLRVSLSKQIIGLLCLVVGIVSFMFLGIYARYELNYDSFIHKSDRIYLLGQTLLDSRSGGEESFAITSGIVAPTLVKDYEDVSYAIRTKELRSPFIYKKESFVADGLYADKDFFNVFPFRMIAGNSETALAEPFTIVLTESFAWKIFGSENPIGKTLIGRGGELYKITAVVEDLPGNTHLEFDYLVSFLTMYSMRDDIDRSWGILNYNSYIKLGNNVSVKEFESKLPGVIKKYHNEESLNRRYFLIPLEDIHLSRGIKMSAIKTKDRKTVLMIAFIGILILLVASINYINLATAGADTKSKEVAVRKICGASRGRIIKQFILESYLLAFICVAVSILIIWAIFPIFINIVGVNIPVSFVFDPVNIFAYIILTLVVGILAGGYPSFILSSFLPVSLFKGSSALFKSKGQWKLRNILIIFQFGISVVLVILAVTIQNQLRYIKNTDVGYNRDNIAVIRIWNQENRDQFKAIKNELLKSPLLSSVSFAGTTPTRMIERNEIQRQKENGDIVMIPMVTTYFVDNDYLDLFKMRVISGRNFSLNQSSDLSDQVIINETLARMLGLEDPVGKKISKWGSEIEIIGLVEDFNFTSMKSKIEPLIFSYYPEWSNIVLVRLSGNDFESSLSYIESVFKDFDSNFALDHSFMDDEYNNLYAEESNMGKVILSFSIIACFIAIIGIYGLVSFVVSGMTKNIGIRKAMGASVLSATVEILKKFLLPVSLATIIFLPLAWYISFNWLKDFSYRTSLGAGQLIFSVLIIVLASFFAIINKTLKAAYVNPADSLRYN